MRHTGMTRYGLIALVLVALGACQGDGAQTADNGSQDAESGPSNGEGRMTEGDSQSTLDLDEAVERAREDLAERTGADRSAIGVIDARRVTWPNGALGCPQEGEMYTQALVRGYYIRLGADGGEYAYHSGHDGRPFHCPAGRSQPPAESGNPEM